MNRRMSGRAVCGALLLAVAATSRADDAEPDMEEAERIFNKGTAYYFGYGGAETDVEQACEFFETAAEMGYDHAQFNLGHCYRRGDGKPQSYRKAVEWYEKALENGIEDAATPLASILLFDDPQPQRFDEAIALLKDRTAAGEQYAPFILGRAYHAGKGVAQSDAGALELYELAAYRGQVMAAALLHYVYDQGLYGQQRDPQKAKAWEHWVESLPMPDSRKTWSIEYALAGLFKHGWGVPQSDAKYHAYMELSGEEAGQPE